LVAILKNCKLPAFPNFFWPVRRRCVGSKRDGVVCWRQGCTSMATAL